MTDPRVTRMADVLVDHSLGIRKGDWLVIHADEPGKPLALAAYRRALEHGANVDVILAPEDAREMLLRSGSDEQLGFVSPMMETVFGRCTAWLQIMSQQNTKALASVAPARTALWAAALGRTMFPMLERDAKGEARWCGTVFPSQAAAQEAEMSLVGYESFVYGACLLDREDPVAEWRAMHDRQEAYVQFLNAKKVIRILGPDTDLRATVAGRRWINDDGQRNFPGGEVLTGPIEDSVEGRIRFSFPGIFVGKPIEDIRLRFEKGRVVEASAARGEDLLRAVLETDAGSRFVGELAVGTNYGVQQFTRNMLFDEKMGGTVHLAVGMSYPPTGAQNKSSIHWDMLCDLRKGGEIHADGECFYRDGKWLIPG